MTINTQAELGVALEKHTCLVCKKGGAGHSVFINAGATAEKHGGYVHMRMANNKDGVREMEVGCCAATILKTKPEGVEVDIRPVAALREFLASKRKVQHAQDFWGTTLSDKMKEAVAAKAAMTASVTETSEPEKAPDEPVKKKGFFG